MKIGRFWIVVASIAMMSGYGTGNAETGTSTFGEDLAFLEKHTDVIVLSDAAGDGRVAVLPALQGRAMTSTAQGPAGLSFGWINRELIASGRTVPHINVFGGEDRFWIGPEGGQYSVFFKKGAAFDLEHWFTPAPIDTEPFDLVSRSRARAVMKKDMRLENYSGTVFTLRVDREIRILEADEAVRALKVTPGKTLSVVAFESINKITNTGEAAWRKDNGLLSIWILGMFNPSPATTVVIPFHPGPAGELGAVVNDAYFGKVPAERLVIGEGVLYFHGDGQRRGKIGLTPRRAKPVLGSYDAANKVLTIVQYTKPEGAADYVNSMWELQKEPYGGDVVNSYNDGPPKPGAKPLGPFYELETSSPAAALGPGESLSHSHRTIHLQGPEADLDAVAKKVLGVTVGEIKSGLGR
jgi:hypothetical protein